MIKALLPGARLAVELNRLIIQPDDGVPHVTYFQLVDSNVPPELWNGELHLRFSLVDRKEIKDAS